MEASCILDSSCEIEANPDNTHSYVAADSAYFEALG